MDKVEVVIIRGVRRTKWLRCLDDQLTGALWEKRYAIQ